MRFKRPSTSDIDMGSNILNLVDVLLLLLIFFMISTTFTKSSQLHVQLPEASAQPPVQSNDKQIEIVITADSHYSINDRNVTRGDIETIKAALSEAAAGDITLPLTIMADANTPHQAVIRAMDAAGQLGFTHLSFATQTPADADK